MVRYAFDEGSGDVLKDSSGNHHHGKIVGATWVKAGAGAASLPATVRGLRLDPASVVTVPGVAKEADGPMTIEGFVTPLADTGAAQRVLTVGSRSFGITRERTR